MFTKEMHNWTFCLVLFKKKCIFKNILFEEFYISSFNTSFFLFLFKTLFILYKLLTGLLVLSNFNSFIYKNIFRCFFFLKYSFCFCFSLIFFNNNPKLYLYQANRQLDFLSYIFKILTFQNLYLMYFKYPF